MKRIGVCAVALLLGGPVVTFAQGRDSAAAVRELGGVQVAGWTGRLDPGDEKAGVKISSTSFVADGTGLRVTTGPAAIYWNAASRGSGTYAAKALFTQVRGGRSGGYHGVIIGGSRLDKPNQNYLYCAIGGNGTFVVRHRIGEELHELAGRTAHAAIRRQDGAGKTTNEVGWKVSSARTSCWVNGVEVWGYAGKDLVGVGKLESLDGVAGIRVDRDLDLVITGFGVAAR